MTRDPVSFLQKHAPQSTATLDQDATLIPTTKSDALYSYQGCKACQPLNTWWAEHEIMLHSEFRDGNVPAGYEQVRLLRESLDLLPSGVDSVRLRSDTAGYQHALMSCCEDTSHPRFGRVEFAIGVDVSPSFKQALVTDVSEDDRRLLYREVTGLVTNMDRDGEDLIHRHRKRCGKSEAAHGVMKDDCAGGTLPSGDFGANAAWWWIMIVARLVLGGSWVSRRLVIRIARDHPVFDVYLQARQRIRELLPAPCGQETPGRSVLLLMPDGSPHHDPRGRPSSVLLRNIETSSHFDAQMRKMLRAASQPPTPAQYKT
jgi:hypothetical protein